MEIPQTQYARSGDTWIAYQVTGQGPRDLLGTFGFAFPIDALWEEPTAAAFLERLGSLGRLILYDRRGTGLSDPVSSEAPATLEQWVLDGIAVLDAAGSERAALIGFDPAASQVATLFAATQPGRVSAVVLMNAQPCPMRRPDWPHGLRPERVEQTLDSVEAAWINGDWPWETIMPSRSNDRRFTSWFLRASRRGGSPSVARMTFKVFYDADLRPVLPTISAPTLVVCRPDTQVTDREVERFVADQIPNARYVEVPGEGLIYGGEVGPLLDEIEEFLTGSRPPPRAEDRVFATLLFTDIVSSTEQSAALGDQRWREMMNEHDKLVRAELERFRGRLVNSTGDGLLAAFDGPARAIRCAQGIAERLREVDIEIRAGLHAGEVATRGEDVTGIAVSIANRVSSIAKGGEILVSRTITDLVAGSGLAFEDRGEHSLKGVPGRWRLFAVKA